MSIDETFARADADPAAMSGMDLLLLGLAADNSSPTIGQLLGMRMTHVDHGTVSFELVTQPLFSNPLGTVHGGIAATMLDSAMACAVHSTLEAGALYTTVELKVNYIKAASIEGERLTAHGTTVHVGRTIATAEGRVINSAGELVAHGTTTCLIRR